MTNGRPLVVLCNQWKEQANVIGLHIAKYCTCMLVMVIITVVMMMTTIIVVVGMMMVS